MPISLKFGTLLEFTHFSKPTKRFIEENSEVLVNGYHGCMVAACRVGGRKTIPLALRLWSSRAPGFKGENDEVLNIIKSVYDATGGKGVMVYDRGGDRPAFYAYLIENNRNFIIRLKGMGKLHIHQNFSAQNAQTSPCHFYHLKFLPHKILIL